jgi:hypothetical protein
MASRLSARERLRLVLRTQQWRAGFSLALAR